MFPVVTLMLFASCNSTKYVADNEFLLTKNTVTVNKSKNKKGEVKNYIIQKPNKKALGFPLGLHFYNIGNKDFITEYSVWKDSFPGREKFTTGVFSEKQSRGLRNSKYKINNWFFKNGDAPITIDTVKTQLTNQNLTQYYINQGYFKAKVESEEFFLENKKSKVEYSVTTDTVYKVDKVTRRIRSDILDSLFTKYESKTLIKTGINFKEETFDKEADRITKLYRNNGIYHFTKNAVRFYGDTTISPYKSNVKLVINNRVYEQNDSINIAPYKVQKVSKINIFTDYSYSKKDRKVKFTEQFKNYNYNSFEELKYNPKYFSKFIFIEPDSIYRDSDTDLTRKNLRRIKNFRLINIKYSEIDSTNLAANIFLTPYKKYSLSADTEITHSNIKEMGLSGKLSLTSRNIFKDASNLMFSIQGSFFNSKDAAAQEEETFFNAWEFGGDITLEIPRLLSPINLERIIPKRSLPNTQFTIGTSFQKNIGLDKQKLTGIINYNWRSSDKISHRFEIVNIQFIKNLNIDSYFRIYQSQYFELVSISESIEQTTPLPPDLYDENGNLKPNEFMDYVLDPNNGFESSHPEEYKDTQNVQKQYNIITENTVIPMMAYEFIYNSRKGFNDPSYSYFKGRFGSAGLITTALLDVNEETNKKELGGVPVAQFLKLDLEYKKFWGNTMDHVVGFRFFGGIAIPYGNSEDMPFSRSYFVGGANDLRAWQVYDLGPGGTKTGLEYNVGTLKLLTSLEYRFKLINNLKGALFVDAGNIWDVTNSTLTEEEGKFKDLSSLQYAAIGTGVGVRYDFNFLVIRVDAGFKTYEPYYDTNRWFRNYNFSNAVYNFGINYPF